MKSIIVSTLIHILLFNLVTAYFSRSSGRSHRNFEQDLENWTGRWFPAQTEDSIPRKQGHHRISMGEIVSNCDDAKTNLDIDWDGSPLNYTCYRQDRIDSNRNTRALLYEEHIPPFYVAMHKCMNETISYDDKIPVYGTHRPLWPVYGEYQYVPKQRWIHSLEHGAVVVLYHPCANPLQKERLKSLVARCLWRHIITPYQFLDEKRPLALVTWGHRLTMSYVNPQLVKDFIRSKALKGPEKISADGQYDISLLSKSAIVSDIDDSILCPDY